MLEGLAGLFSRRQGKEEGARYSEAMWDTSGGRERVAGDMSAMLRAYLGWVYVCCHKNAQVAASIPLRMYVQKQSRGTKLNFRTRMVDRKVVGEIMSRAHLQKWARKAAAENVEELTDHPFLDLVYMANPQENGCKLIYRTVMYLGLTGNDYWWLFRNGLGVPSEIWTLMPDRMKAKTSPEPRKVILGWEYTIGTTKMPMKREDVVQFIQPNPRSLIYGWGNLAGASDDADIMKLMAGYEKHTFDNMARPDMAIVVDGEMDESMRKRTLQDFRDKFQGNRNAHKTILLEGGADVKPISFPPRELAFLQGRKMVRDAVCAAFGVPVSLVVTEDVNRANAREGQRFHRENTVKPLLTLMEEEINENVMPIYGDNVFCAFDDPTMPDLEEQRAQRESNLKTGFSSINEERVEDGLQPVAWGDVPIMANTMVAFGTAPPPASAPPEPKGIKTSRRNRVTSQEQLREEMLPRVERFLIEYSKAQERDVMREFNKGFKTPQDAVNAFTVGLNDWSKRFRREFEPIYKGVVQTSGTRTLEEMQVVGIAFDIDNPLMQQHFAEYIPRLAGDVNAELLDDLQRNLSEGTAAGESLVDLRRRVEAIFADRQGFRATRIARTEVCRAQSFAAEEAMKQSGVVKAKEWVTAVPCDLCAPLEGQKRRLGETFTTTSYGPIYHPPLHPNCRCVLVEVVD